MALKHIDEHAREFYRAFADGEDPHRLAGKLFEGFEGEVHIARLWVRRVMDVLFVNEITKLAEAGREQLPPYGLGRAAFMSDNTHPSHLSPVSNFSGDRPPLLEVGHLLSDTLSTHLNLLIDKAPSDWQALIEAYRNQFDFYVDDGLLKSHFAGGLQTAGHVIGGALMVLPKQMPGLTPQDYLAGARQSTPALGALGNLPLPLAVNAGLACEIPDQPIQHCFSVQQQNGIPVLTMNGAHFQGISARRPEVHTGCPAGVGLDGRYSPIERLWRWGIDVAEQAKLYGDS